jgi:hypothetical protein
MQKVQFKQKIYQTWIHDQRLPVEDGMFHRIKKVWQQYPNVSFYMTAEQILYIKGIISFGEMVVTMNQYKRFQVYNPPEFYIDSYPFQKVLHGVIAEYNTNIVTILKNANLDDILSSLTLFKVIPGYAVKVRIDVGGGEIRRAYAVVRKIGEEYHVKTCDGNFEATCIFDIHHKCFKISG